VFFQRFPQGIFVLHSFCTTVAAFFVAAVYRFKHSADSACVRCFRRLLKIAAELAVSAVLEGELLEVSQSVLRRASGYPGVAASSEGPCSQGRTKLLVLRDRRDSLVNRGYVKRRVFRSECGLVSVHFTALRGEGAGGASTSNAARVAGLGRICFGQFGHGFSRIQLRENPFASLYIRLYWCGCATEMRRTG
jgi:hypothetical protein